MSINTCRQKRMTVYRVRLMMDGKDLNRTFKRKIDAVLFERDMLVNGGLPNSKEYTFKQAAEEWILKHAEVRKSGSGVITDKNMLKNNVYPHIGHLRLGKVHPIHIDDMIASLRKDKRLSNSTLNRNLCVVRTIFNYCLKRRLIFNNPMTAIQPLKVDACGFKFWSLKDANIFLEFAKQKYVESQRAIYLIYLTALNTGMRMGELIGLRWRDVDFENHIMTVCRTFSCHERKVRETTKSHKVRHVPINSAIFEELKEAYKNRGKSELVFNCNGYMLDAGNLRSRYFEKDIQASDVQRIRFHDMRHTYASHFMMNAGNPYDLQKILGHSSLRMTERYAHLSKAFLASKGNIVSFGADSNVIKVEFAAAV